jgi:hypothetical protein
MLNRATAAALTFVLAAAAASTARATPYEAFIDIENEDDLDDLLATGQIEPETYEALRTLLDRGVDLDTASRAELYSLPNLTYHDVDAILEYRSINRFIADPADLVVAGALTEEKLLSISAFLIVRGRERSKYQPRGFVRAFTRASQYDDRAPPIGLRARVTAGKEYKAGLAATMTRLRIGDVTWDPNRDGLIADQRGVQAHVPKYYVGYQSDSLVAVAGTYRVGFGERLTFDNSSDYTPNGIYLDDQLNRDYYLSRECIETRGELGETPCPSDDRDYVTPDFGWSDGLRGIAAGSGHIVLGDGWLQTYAWGSYQNRSIYQYEIVDSAACADVRDDTSDICKAPPVFVRPDGDPLAPAPAYAYQTLPAMFAESLVGGNVTYFAARRDFLGITAYGATTSWLPDTPEDVRLDAQEWSRWPTGGRYGAIGAQLGIGRGIYDVFAEVSHSFDRMPAAYEPSPIDGGGGPAAIVRATRNLKASEIEVSARYYDPDFANPYSGAIASSDEVDGHRARGEHGVRVRYTYKEKKGLALRVGVDGWRSLVRVPIDLDGDMRADVEDHEYVARGDIFTRADLDLSDQLRGGLWLQYTDKGLGEPQREAECYEVQFDDGEINEPVTCTGTRFSTTLRARFKPVRDWTLFAQVRHSLLDDDGKRHDLSALASALWKQSDRLRLQGRVRYFDQDVEDLGAYESTVVSSVDATIRLRAKDRLRLRSDVRVWVDNRDSTADRSPNPEVWLTVDYEAKF